VNVPEIGSASTAPPGPYISSALQRSMELMRAADSVFPTRPLVVDSDVLMRNVVREVRPGRPPTKFLNHIRMGTVRAFVAPHQVHEVRRHLRRVAADVGVDPESARRMFENVYLPMLWQVDTTGLPSNDPLVVEVAEADGADVETAKLAVLLGVRVLTANKDHFRQVAIVNEWLTVMAAYADAGVFDGANASLVVSVRVSGEGAIAAAKGVQNGATYLVEHPRVALGFGLAVLFIVFLGVMVLSDHERRERVQRFLEDARKVGAEALHGAATSYGRALEAATEAEPVLAAELLTTPNPTPEQVLARRLAVSRWPIPGSVLVSGHTEEYSQSLTRALREYPAFVRTREGWQLGRH